MIIREDDRRYLFWPSSLDVDTSTAAAPTLHVDGVTYTMAWVGAAVQSGALWLRTARTTVFFIGSNRTASGDDVALPPGRYHGHPFITVPDGQIITGPAFPIDVDETPTYTPPASFQTIIDGGTP